MIFGIYSIKSFLALMLSSYVLTWGVYFALSRESTVVAAARCAVTTTTILVLIALLEVAALWHVVDYGLLLTRNETALFKGKPWHNPTMQLDRELLYHRRPNTRIMGETKGDIAFWSDIPPYQLYRYDVQYDGLGFRNDHDIEQASIVVVGDSFVEAPLVPTAAPPFYPLKPPFGRGSGEFWSDGLRSPARTSCTKEIWHKTAAGDRDLGLFRGE